MIEKYLVGGAVRDQLLGLQPKDYDFTVVAESFADMKMWLEDQDAEIFLEKEEYGTIRAKVSYEGRAVAADFVLARADGYYSDGRHPDEVRPSSLYDDLARRDFTVNAMAFSDGGILIDPFGGKSDLERGYLRAVGRPRERLSEDALRVLRAIRFAVTKGFVLDSDLLAAFSYAPVLYNLQYKISQDRIREELLKSFKHDTLATIKLLERVPLVRAIVLGEMSNIWLKPTTEE